MDYQKLFEKYKDKMFNSFCKLSDDDIAKLEQDDYLISVSIKRLAKKKEIDSSSCYSDFPYILNKITYAYSKEKADAILTESLKQKKDMIAFAKYVKVPAQTKDSLKVIRSRIIESTVGARLRSNVIQGLTS